MNVRRSILVPAAALVLTCFHAGCDGGAQEATATLAVTGARVWTGNPEQPWASAVASAGERILAVGTDAEIRRYVGEVTEVIEAGGGMLVPGMIDTHVHFITGGSGLASVQLRDAATPEEFVERIAAFAATLPPG